MDKKKIFADMIRLARRAPLANMDEAEAAAGIIKQFSEYAMKEIEGDEAKQEFPPE